MSLLDGALIGVGAMIGAGIFVLIGIAAGVVGPAILLSFILNGAVALITAMSYAELGACHLRKSNGEAISAAAAPVEQILHCAHCIRDCLL